MSEILISNKLTAKYDLMGYSESTIDVTLTVGTYVDSQIQVEISSKALYNSDKAVSIEVVFGDYSEIGVVISPSIFSNIPIEIEVNPHNRMSVYYELSTPPTVIYETFPVQDSFVIQRNPYSNINYGTNNSMIVGIDQKGENISFVKFDTSDIAHDVVLKSAKARFFYSQLSSEDIEILKVNGSWQEYGITYNNMPKDLTKLNYSYDVNEEKRYIEFDVLPTVSEWIKGLDNHGFALKSTNGVSVFGTREYPLAPELIIEYYSPLPFSNDLSKKQIEITVARSHYSDITVSLDVKSNFDFSYIPIEIYTKQENEIFNLDIPVEIEVPNYEGYSDIAIEIAVLLEDISEIPVEILVPINDGVSDLPIEISIVRINTSEIPIEIEVSYYMGISDIEVEIERSNVNVGLYNIEVEIEVKSYEDYNEAEVLIEVPTGNYSTIEVNLVVPSYVYSQISVEISVAQYVENSDVNVEIEVPTRLVDIEIPIEISVWGVSDSNVEIDIYTRVGFIEEVEVSIEVGISNRYAYVFMF